MINFLTVCVGDRYGAEYPNAIYRMVRRHFHQPFNFYCLSRLPHIDLEKGIKKILPSHDLPGWWNKLYMFSPLMPEGRLIYLDLDIVIMGDVTDLFTRYQGDYCGDEDHIHWGTPEFGNGRKHPEIGPIDCSLGTAVVSMKAHSHPEVWEKYMANQAMVHDKFKMYGDQVFTSWALGGKFDLWEKLYPQDHGIASYKFDVLGRMPKHLAERMKREDKGPQPPHSFKIINFHGKPKPFEVMNEPNHYWLKDALR